MKVFFGNTVFEVPKGARFSIVWSCMGYFTIQMEHPGNISYQEMGRFRPRGYESHLNKGNINEAKYDANDALRRIREGLKKEEEEIRF